MLNITPKSDRVQIENNKFVKNPVQTTEKFDDQSKKCFIASRVETMW